MQRSLLVNMGPSTQSPKNGWAGHVGQCARGVAWCGAGGHFRRKHDVSSDGLLEAGAPAASSAVRLNQWF
jgi:hypothetical protein